MRNKCFTLLHLILTGTQVHKLLPAHLLGALRPYSAQTASFDMGLAGLPCWHLLDAADESAVTHEATTLFYDDVDEDKGLERPSVVAPPGGVGSLLVFFRSLLLWKDVEQIFDTGRLPCSCLHPHSFNPDVVEDLAQVIHLFLVPFFVVYIQTQGVSVGM